MNACDRDRSLSFAVSEACSLLLQVQERFDVDIKPLPEKIDAQSYMNNP